MAWSQDSDLEKGMWNLLEMLEMEKKFLFRFQDQDMFLASAFTKVVQQGY